MQSSGVPVLWHMSGNGVYREVNCKAPKETEMLVSCFLRESCDYAKRSATSDRKQLRRLRETERCARRR